MNIYKNYSLKSRHTFGMDVKTALFMEYSTKEELKDIEIVITHSDIVEDLFINA